MREGHAPPTARRRGASLLLMAVVIAALAVTGLVVVRAEWSPAPAIKPYDPLPRW